MPYDKTGNDTPPDPAAYAALIGELFADAGCQIMLEPGRLIAANAGILVGSVVRSKYGRAKNFMIIDAAMTELLRPTLYGAHHHIAPVRDSTGDNRAWDIVGPVCESGDFLGLAAICRNWQKVICWPCLPPALMGRRSARNIIPAHRRRRYWLMAIISTLSAAAPIMTIC